MQKGIPLFTKVVVSWALASLLLFFYSFTQVSLSLTLTSVGIWQTIQKAFLNIGYFQRPASTVLYIGIITFLFILYIWLLIIVRRGLLSVRHLWKLIFMVSLVLVFSYPAFSNDIFNYMFTAKTILVYHKNPYAVIPLDFLGFDPWLSFLHWTHLPSAYTPVWIALTLPSYLLGFGYFLPIMWNMKILVALFYVGAIWLIKKIVTELDPTKAALSMAIFAFNPLVLVESLVSAHNDVTMMALALLAMYVFLKQKPLAAFFWLSLSIGLKFMTVFLLPVVLFKWNRVLALAAMALGLTVVLFQREILPWYLLWVLPFVALLPRNLSLIILSGGISLGLLLRYAPFLYYGHWDSPVPVIKLWVTGVPIVVALLLAVLMGNLPTARRFFRLKSRLK